MVGRYQLKEEIGRGGMATVYRALDPNSNREVAIKLLPRAMMHDPRFRSRFDKELRTVSSLEHVAIVPVYDSGVDDLGEEDGQPYFVMRYMAGGSLAGLLRGGKLSLQRTAEIIEKIALGLDYAHKKGIVHRDLKPENILFDASDTPYLSDFGVAKLTEDTHSDTGSDIVGTPAYASPEQASGENDKVDHRSDIYGLGVLVYQMLTGNQPFTGDNAMKVLVKHISEPVPNILDANPDLPAALETIIKTAMAKRKENRYQSVLEFAYALSVAAFGPDRTVPRALALERSRLVLLSRRKNAFMGFGAILLIAVAGLVYFLPNFVSSPTPTSTVLVIPSLTPTIFPTITLTPTVSPTLTVVPTSTLELPTLVPTPNGGADRIALLSGNEIVSVNLDGTDPEAIDLRNIDKSNLQWIADGRLVYISPTRNCAYAVDIENNTSNEFLCFPQQQKLEGFRVSPNGAFVAISVARTLYIVPFDVKQFEEVNTRFLLTRIENSCVYSPSLLVKDVRWSRDGRKIAALVVDTQKGNSDQIHIFEVSPPDCGSPILLPTDKFPGDRFKFGGNSTIPDYEWDGDRLFLLNDSIRNDGFGNLYLYDSESHVGKVINPIGGNCCYRGARWSPDGGYILFLYQFESESSIHFYYIPVGDLEENFAWNPIEITFAAFSLRDNPQPLLRPAQ